MLRSTLLVLVVSAPVVSALAQAVQEPIEQRLNAANAARALRQTYFDDSGDPPLSLEQAFSHLAGAPLSDPSFLAARQRSLDDQRAARARERLDAGGTSRAAAIRATCDAEDAADALEARLLSALAVGLEVALGFSADSIDLARRPWQVARETARRMAADDPNFAEAQRNAVSASEAERRLLLYQANALRRMTLPDDQGLRELVQVELADGSQFGIDDEARDRLSRASPLLGADLSLLVRTTLDGTITTTDTGTTALDDDDDETNQTTSTATSQLREAEGVRHAASLARIQTLDAQCSLLETEFDQARALGILDNTRGQRLRTAALASRELVRTTRNAIAELLIVQRAHRAERRERERDFLRTSRGRTSNFVAALDERDANTSAELDAFLNVDKKALALRRDLEPFGDAVTRGALLSELFEEIEDAPLWLQLEWRKDLRWIRSMPERATDLNAVGELIGVSFDLFLLVFLWIYVRNQAPRWLRRAVSTVQRKDVSAFGFGGRARRLSERELAPIARYATDAAGAFALHRLLLPRTELFALLALIWVGWALLKAIPAAIRLLLPLVGRALDPLETSNELPPEIQALGEKTTYWFLWWWILSSVAAFVAVPFLQADRFARLVELVSLASFVLLTILALVRWSPWTRQFIANLADQSAISTWLARPGSSPVSRIIRSGFGTFYIFARLVFWALVDRGWLSRTGTSIALSQLKLASADAEPLGNEQRQEIRDAHHSRIERTKELEVLSRAFESWRRERRRGIVAVIGDNGQGKSVFLEQALAMFEASGSELAVMKLELPIQTRASSLRKRLEWLTEPLELKIPPKSAARATLQNSIIAHLESLPPRVFLVDDLHFLLRRTVGGFDVLEIARNIIQACADEHFWVLTLHRPAWIYIDGVSTAMKLAFRERIELPALSTDELGDLLVEDTQTAGFEPEFRSLLLGRRPYADEKTLEHKARKLYWRIVSQASRGNPRVMLDFWLSSLGAPGATTNGNKTHPVPVYLFAGYNDDDVVNLSDEYLFLLTALVVHDGMKLEDLAEVLNVVLTRVRVACQHLESLGIIGEVKRRFVVTPSWQPTVVRVLDRRNFVRH